MFHSGQKVVCVDEDGAKMLTLNAVYTVKSVEGPYRCRWRGRILDTCMVHLYEARPEEDYYGFCPQRFRPAVDRQTDISIFTKMLVPKVKADA